MSFLNFLSLSFRYHVGFRTRYSDFGLVPRNFSLWSVHCNGSESSLLDCEIEKKKLPCLSDDGAGVVCANSISLQKPASLGYEGEFEQSCLVLGGVPERFYTSIVESVYYNVILPVSLTYFKSKAVHKRVFFNCEIMIQQ